MAAYLEVNSLVIVLDNLSIHFIVFALDHQSLRFRCLIVLGVFLVPAIHGRGFGGTQLLETGAVGRGVAAPALGLALEEAKRADAFLDVVFVEGEGLGVVAAETGTRASATRFGLDQTDIAAYHSDLAELTRFFLGGEAASKRFGVQREAAGSADAHTVFFHPVTEFDVFGIKGGVAAAGAVQHASSRKVHRV